MTIFTRRAMMVSVAATGLATRPWPGASAMAAAPAAAWDLTELYPSDLAWESERSAIAARLPQLATFKGTLARDAATLRSALQLQSAISIKVSRLYTYASLKRDEDVRIAANQEQAQKATDLAAASDEAGSWIGPELLTVGKDRITRFLAVDPGLARFRFQLEDQLRQAAHTLTPEGEAILAGAAAPLAAPGDIRVQLVSSDIPRPSVTLSDGTRAVLDDQNYTLYRAAPVRADRKLVFDRFWQSYKGFENALGTALQSQVRGAIFLAKARHYPSALDAALAAPNIPTAVYRTLIAQTNAGLPVLHRYFDLRRRMLGLPDLAYYDIYPNLVTLDRTFTLNTMRSLTIAAVQPLGRDYAATFARATADRWMDPRPRPGKQSGAYMNPGAYEVHPYLLLNLSDRYDGLTTYAHEWGHAMHTLLASKAQPWETANYPIFTAEIASTCHEALLADYMLKQAATKQEKLFILGQMMENFRSTFFRQAMFAEFQLAIHDLAERGEGLSGAKMTELNLALLKKYHGPNVVIDPLYGIEWAYVPHYFHGFYVFQYATSITAATYFADRVLHGGAAGRETYLTVLKAGGSNYGYEILRASGLDMATPSPYQTLIGSFAAVLDQAEALIGPG